MNRNYIEEDRMILGSFLENILGTKNIYFQPPDNIQINYPCIIFERTDVDSKKANNSVFIQQYRYKILVISKNPDELVLNKLSNIPNCSYEQHYIMNNLHHDVYSLIKYRGGI